MDALSPLDRLGAELLRRRTDAGLTQDRLAVLAGYPKGRTIISKCERGRELPSERFTERIDAELDADGAIIRLYRQAEAARLRRAADELAPPESTEVPQSDLAAVSRLDRTTDLQALSDEHHPAAEEDTTDRRQLLQTGGLATGFLFTTGAAASALSEQLARADPTPMTLREIGVDLRRIAESYNTTPRLALVPHLEAGWIRVQKLLDSRVSPQVRRKLTGQAGWYSYYIATLAFDLGQDAVAEAHLPIATHHAEEAGDRLLAGSVAAMEWALAHFGGDYIGAMNIAATAQVDTDPYILPTLAANEAESAARAKRQTQARAALDNMWNHFLQDVAVPGPLTLDEQNAHATSAHVYAALGDGVAAESHARHSLRLLTGTGQFGEVGGTYNALAWSFLRRKNPDPEQAADAARSALRSIEQRPVRWVIRPTASVWQSMNAEWGRLPAVADLGIELGQHRALLAGAGTR
ncbi:helix-turn-helix domain-containing protein [Parafrankia sp. FMc2]|uniref:helix-turn-helix domain-containing protein n=1 Tax=Parafrankia sp. FMc2 TaxID=3233196 RepID=UPI0034D4000A